MSYLYKAEFAINVDDNVGEMSLVVCKQFTNDESTAHNFLEGQAAVFPMLEKRSNATFIDASIRYDDGNTKKEIHFKLEDL